MRTRRGLTLVELVMSITALSVLVAGAVQVMLSAHGGAINAFHMQRAAAAGRTLMAEVLAVGAWDELTTQRTAGATHIPTASATISTEEGSRASFDDVDDYNGLHLANPTSRNGTPLVPSSMSMTADFAVEFVNPQTLQPSGSPTDAKRIAITISWNAIGDWPSQITITSHRCNI